MAYQIYPRADAVRAHAVTLGEQRFADMAPLADGGAIVVWSAQQDPDAFDGYDILAQRYDAQGNKVGGDTLLFSGPDDSSRPEATVTGLTGGGYAVSFADSNSSTMRVATYDGAGAKVGDVNIALPDRDISDTRTASVETTRSGYGASTITGLEDGGFAITWAAGYAGILAQYGGAGSDFGAVFDATGAMTSGPFQVTPWIGNVSYGWDLINYTYGSAALENGSYVIVTRIGTSTPGNDSGYPSVGIQIRDADGQLVTGPFLAASTITEDMGAPAVTGLADGSFVVVWNSETATLWRQFAQDGTPMGTETPLDGYLYDRPTVAPLPDGGFLVGLRSKSGYNPSFSAYAMRFDAAGEQVGERQDIHSRGDFDINSIQVTPEFAALGDGSLLAMWGGHASWNGDGYDVLTRLFMPERIGTDADDILSADDIGTAFFARDGDDSLTGSAMADVMQGGSGNDTMTGLDGDDSLKGDDGQDVLAGGTGNDVIEGDAGDDLISGGPGDDTLTPGEGADTVEGGEGADVAVIDADSDDIILRGPREALMIETMTGVTTVSGVELFEFTDTSLTLDSLLLRDQLILGSGAADVLTGGDGNDAITGFDGADTLMGGFGDDTLLGLAGDDSLGGGAGDDVLDGGTGNDTLSGGLGEDRMIGGRGADSMVGGQNGDFYFVDDLGDVVVEVAGDVGIDRVASGVDFDISGIDIETLILGGSANTTGIGNDKANYILGSMGNNSIEGGGGNDRIEAASGDDTLRGGAGDDTLNGGPGSDTIYVDDIGDKVAESRRWDGTDHVISSVDFRMGTAHIETLQLTGTARLGAGNGLQNTIFGTDGDNILDGGKNNDALWGGLGDDIYLLRAPGDDALEAADAGIDTVRAFRTIELAANIENLHIQTLRNAAGEGVPGINGIGNALDNEIVGNPFDNVLIGREGNDILRGQAGADTFVFDRALGAGNVDRIVDFNTAGAEGDLLYLKAAVFAGTSKGALDEALFVAGTEAQEADDRFVFDQTSGALWFDADGSGAAGQIMVATFDNGASLSAGDIFIV